METDRYGFYPLFYYSRGNEFGISSNIVRLLQEGAPPDIDRDALAVFLHLGFFIGNATPFLHIKAVPPSRRFTWGGALHVEEVRHLGAQLTISRAEAIDTYAELFRNAIAKRLPTGPEFALPLSGGRDSRHILLELCEAGFRPQYCITANKHGAGDNDVEIARLLTDALGLKHVVAAQTPRFEAERRKNLLTSFCADEHAWLMPAADFLNGSVETIYDGIGGDVLSASLFQNQTWLDLHRAGRCRELAEKLMKPSTEAIQGTLDPAFQLARSTDVARAQIVLELERYADAANPTTMFFFWNRTRREIALSPFNVFGGVKTCFCPYLDHPLFDFLASLPAEMLLDKTFHSDTIGAAHPRFSKIPYSAPRRHKSKLMSGAFALRVGWYGLLTQPTRIGRLSRLAVQILRRSLSSTYRKENATTGPVLLLYLFQLSNTVRETAHEPERRSGSHVEARGEDPQVADLRNHSSVDHL